MHTTLLRPALYYAGDETGDGTACLALHHALALIQAAAQASTTRVWLFTRCAQSVQPADCLRPAPAGLVGLARTARSELMRLQLRTAGASAGGLAGAVAVDVIDCRQRDR